MSLPLRIEVDARQDFDKAADWYEEKQTGLGLEFIDEMNSVIELVLERPDLGPLVPYLDARLELRWRLAPRFPYAVVYRIESYAIRVFAFAHLHRAPAFWMKR
jgi:toxin ParE1/3/4